MSSTQIQPGGSPTPALSTVATDQQTIFGSGTAEDPLTTDGGSGQSSGRTFLATLQTFGSDHVGQPVTVSVTGPTLGITSVAKASGVSTQAAATCAGLMTVLGGAGVPSTVQYDGIVTLTHAQWDAFAGTTGGLTASEVYFLSTSGTLDTVPPATPGEWSSQVGIGLNSTQMLLCTPSVPIIVT